MATVTTRFVWTKAKMRKFATDWNKSKTIEDMVKKYKDDEAFEDIEDKDGITKKDQVINRLNTRARAIRIQGTLLKVFPTKARKRIVLDVEEMNDEFEGMLTSDELEAAKEQIEIAQAADKKSKKAAQAKAREKRLEKANA